MSISMKVRFHKLETEDEAHSNRAEKQNRVTDIFLEMFEHNVGKLKKSSMSDTGRNE